MSAVSCTNDVCVCVQSAYVHTSVNDAAILVVFELVAKCSDEDAAEGTTNDVGCGFGFISLFRRSVKSVDVSDISASPATR